jgi:hypothetical protein
MNNAREFTRRQFLSSASFSLAGLACGETALAKSSYAAAVLKKHPVGYWRLGEKHGPEAADSSGNNHHGKYLGVPAFGQRGAIEGDPDTAVRFAPPATSVEIASSAQFSQPSSGRGLTVEVWMRPDTLVFPGESGDPYVMWLGKGQQDEMEWGFRFYSNSSTRPNRISAYVWNAEGGLGSGAYFQDLLKAGQWLHVAATFDPGNENNPRAGVSIYKNGELRGGPSTQKGALYAAYNVRPPKGPAPLRLGTRDLSSFFTGALDEVAIYPEKLTLAEVREHYRLGIGAA